MQDATEQQRIPVKVVLKETKEIHRLNLEKPLELSKLRSAISEIYSLEDTQNFGLYYLDEDEDEITVDSQSDLETAISYFGSGTLRFIVAPKRVVKGEYQPNSSEELEGHLNEKSFERAPRIRWQKSLEKFMKNGSPSFGFPYRSFDQNKEISQSSQSQGFELPWFYHHPSCPYHMFNAFPQFFGGGMPSKQLPEQMLNDEGTWEDFEGFMFGEPTQEDSDDSSPEAQVMKEEQREADGLLSPSDADPFHYAPRAHFPLHPPPHFHFPHPHPHPRPKHHSTEHDRRKRSPFNPSDKSDTESSPLSAPMHSPFNHHAHHMPPHSHSPHSHSPHSHSPHSHSPHSHSPHSHSPHSHSPSHSPHSHSHSHSHPHPHPHLPPHFHPPFNFPANFPWDCQVRDLQDFHGQSPVHAMGFKDGMCAFNKVSSPISPKKMESRKEVPQESNSDEFLKGQLDNSTENEIKLSNNENMEDQSEPVEKKDEK
ncbi:uncharacterized protein MONOS_1366 [Monocercomonoides exilis]|uniref:uncharacterized protein n=1 Tax=Monocercomonoides exilis TaxID=2049356 RepID=UPI0035595317|nr:hypothetical protein MONOS_1366 [Monocercomonoides exilis]|eukprot:MONOS_1366.1-p1 / transcript=MONOS_1366.1 / gene=MONOS_1366 / organism=Monocercomonoides_exilis_PA203 / gene_product=unspecified product / transcript_product=unspecified product / location=Mono_scaffold00023:199386-200828(-) / protein_length=480 / sequence_SO=supercontig / SO=protein_coding / is_pseudo=false